MTDILSGLNNIGTQSETIYASKNYASGHKCVENLNNRLGYFSNIEYNGTNSKKIFDDWSNLLILIKLYNGNDKCLCGHAVVDNYLVKNTRTGQKVVLGSRCIENINKTAIKEFNQSNRRQAYCYACCKHYNDIDKHYEKKSHKEQYRKNIEHFKKTKLEQLYNRKHEEYLDSFKRHCIGCNVVIEDEEPQWKIRCVDCYIKNKKAL